MKSMHGYGCMMGDTTWLIWTLLGNMERNLDLEEEIAV